MRTLFLLEGPKDKNSRPEDARVVGTGKRRKMVQPKWKTQADHMIATGIAAWLFVGGDFNDATALKAYISACKGRRGGKGKQMQEHAAALSDGVSRGRGRARGMREVAAAMGVQGPLRRIEGYDISHMQGTGAVASVSVIIDGEQRPDLYRWYRITDETVRIGHSDDYASISEVRQWALSFFW